VLYFVFFRKIDMEIVCFFFSATAFWNISVFGCPFIITFTMLCFFWIWINLLKLEVRTFLIPEPPTGSYLFKNKFDQVDINELTFLFLSLSVWKCTKMVCFSVINGLFQKKNRFVDHRTLLCGFKNQIMKNSGTVFKLPESVIYLIIVEYISS